MVLFSLKYVRRRGTIGLGKPVITSMPVEEFDLLIERDKEQNFQPLEVDFIDSNHLSSKQPRSKLPFAVVEFLKHIMDKYMPLGIMRESQIEFAQDILHKIDENLKIENQDEIKCLSEQFYRIIPHMGKSDRRPIIDSLITLKAKMNMLHRFEVVLRTIHRAVRYNTNPFDYICEKYLETSIQLVDRSSHSFGLLSECIAKTQQIDSFEIANIFRVECESYASFTTRVQNHCYLYHSTFANNILGILKEGLLVAPSHVHSCHRFFGKGIYFWDSAAAALDLFRTNNFDTGIVLVCRAALGKQQPSVYWKTQDDEYPWESDSDSLFAEGEKYSNVTDNHETLDGAKIYCGAIQKTEIREKLYFYNRYVIRKTDQVRIDYIVEFKKKNNVA